MFSWYICACLFKVKHKASKVTKNYSPKILIYHKKLKFLNAGGIKPSKTTL